MFVGSHNSSGREIDDHEWQHTESKATSLIETFTEPNDLIVDPMAGSGTIGRVATRLNHQCLLINRTPMRSRRSTPTVTTKVKFETPYPRLTDENQHPDATVEELAVELLVDPNKDRIVFISTAVEDRFDLYLAHGVTAVDEVPAVIQRISENVVVGISELKWADTNVIQFWRDGYDCTQEMTLSELIYKPVASTNNPHPAATSDGGEA